MFSKLEFMRFKMLHDVMMLVVYQKQNSPDKGITLVIRLRKHWLEVTAET